VRTNERERWEGCGVDDESVCGGGLRKLPGESEWNVCKERGLGGSEGGSTERELPDERE
jgi:hypothetical protein